MKTSINKAIGTIFIHGAGLGNYIWEDIQPYINASTLGIEFPNRANNNELNAHLRFEDYVDSAILEVEKFKKKKLIIVAHSIGTLIGLRLAEHFKTKVIGFVSIGGVIPKRGDSFLSCLPFPQKIIVSMILRTMGAKPTKLAIVKGLCNDLNQNMTEKVIKNFVQESKYLFTDKSKVVVPKIDKLYISLSKDQELSFKLQKRMAKNFGCHHIMVLESGHLPMLSIPETLLKILNEFIGVSRRVI